MNDTKDIAITLLQTLANATGAEFEDERLAVDIISHTITEVVKNNAVLRIVSNNEEYFCGADFKHKCRFKLRGKCTSTGDCDYKNTEVAVCDMQNIKKCAARKHGYICNLDYECPFKQTDC